MERYLKYLFILVFMNSCTVKQQNAPLDNGEEIKAAIIALETQALELWNNGNPDGFLELSSDDVVYIDPLFEQKLEGKQALTDYYNGARGQVKVDSYEIIKPVVQLTSDAAVLTYNLVSHSRGEIYRWNCTEVYQQVQPGKWMIIHTHWSFVQPVRSNS